MQRVTYDVSLIQALLGYLKGQPWHEVNPLIQALETQGVVNQPDTAAPETPPCA